MEMTAVWCTDAEDFAWVYVVNDAPGKCPNCGDNHPDLR